MPKVHKLDLLIGLYIFCIVASELMGAKTFPLTSFSWLHLNASVAIFLIPIVFSINDIIVEVYGKERARSMITTGLVVVAMTLVFAALATALPPSTRFGPSEAAYDQVFHLTLRMSAASLIAFAVALFTDLFIFSKIREKLGKKSLWLRNNASNFVAQFVDSLVFVTLAFYALDMSFSQNFDFLLGIIIPYWLLRCAMSVIETPLVYAGVKWLKK